MGALIKSRKKDWTMFGDRRWEDRKKIYKRVFKEIDNDRKRDV